MGDARKVSLIIEALDRATAPVKAINRAIASITAPARGATRALESLNAQLGLKRLERGVDQTGRSMDKAWKSARNLAGMGLVLGGALAGGWFAMERMANAGDGVVKTAQSLGMSIPQWQQLAYAGESVGLAADQTAQAMGTLGQNALKAALGNQEAMTWFRRAGVEVLDGNGRLRKQADLLNEVADRFAAMPDGPKKVALAQGLMNNSSREMIALLSQGAKGLRARGAEAERLGLVNERLAREEAELASGLLKTRLAARGVANAVAVAVVPAVAALLPPLQRWIEQNRELIGTRAQEFVAGLSTVLPQLITGLGNVASVALDVVGAVNQAVQWFGGWQTVIYAVAAFMATKLVLAVAAAAKAFLALGAAILTTPIGWIVAGIAAIATGAYLLIKHWDAVKEWFLGFIKTVLSPVLVLMEKIAGLVPDVLRGDAIARGGAAPGATMAPSAISPATASAQQFGGKLSVEIVGAPVRVRKMESTDGLDLDVEHGGMTAGAY